MNGTKIAYSSAMSSSTCTVEPNNQTFVEWMPEPDERAALALLCQPVHDVPEVQAVEALSDALRFCMSEVAGFVAALRDAGENDCADSCAHALKRAMDRAENALAMHEIPSSLKRH